MPHNRFRLYLRQWASLYRLWFTWKTPLRPRRFRLYRQRHPQHRFRFQPLNPPSLCRRPRLHLSLFHPPRTDPDCSVK
jgi:hypothetical protein